MAKEDVVRGVVEKGLEGDYVVGEQEIEGL